MNNDEIFETMFQDRFGENKSIWDIETNEWNEFAEEYRDFVDSIEAAEKNDEFEHDLDEIQK